MAKKRQNYGIKFPFTNNNENGVFIDLNTNIDEKIGSEIAHLILTPKGTRLKMPDFGTNLIRFIFNHNDNISWGDVESEIKEAVTTYISNASINEVKIIEDESNDNALILSVNFSVIKGASNENNIMLIRL